MTRPENIKLNEPIEVSNMEYRFIVENMTGIVFHRRDDDGVCWIKPAHPVSVTMLGELFNRSRPA